MKYLLTIDAGMSQSSPGSFCYSINGVIQTVQKIPGYYPHNLFDFIYESPETTEIVIEEVPISVGGNRGASSVKLNRQYGAIIGYLMGMGRKFEEVSPKRWQSPYDLPKDYNDRKHRLWEIAQEKYPDVRILKPCADSIMITDYVINHRHL